MSGLDTDGYAVLPGILAPARCADLAERLPPLDGPGSRNLLSVPEVRALADELRETKPLSPLLAGLVAVQCTAFIKQQSRNWAVALHRDLDVPAEGTGPWTVSREREGQSYLRPPREFLQRLLAVRLHLDGAPEGDLRVIPGSHLTELPPGNKPGLSVPVPQGDVLLMRPLLLHGSDKLRESPSRRVLHFLFAPPELPPGYQWLDWV